MTSEPVRLFEDPATAASLRADLARATADQVQVEGLDLVAGLAGLEAAAATVTSSTTAVAGSSLLGKIGVEVLVVGAVVVWLGLGSPSSDPLPASEGIERVAMPSGDVEISPSLGVAPLPLEVPVTPDEVEAEAELEAEVEVEVEAKADLAEPLPLQVVAEPEPEPRHRAPKASPADQGLREAKLVAKARSNLARDPARALALAEQAEREFPRGQLVEERRALAIRALVALGRVQEANDRAVPFLAEYGRGAHAAVVRRALANH